MIQKTHRNNSSRILYALCVVMALSLASLVSSCRDDSKGRIVEPKEGPAHLTIPQPEYNFGLLHLSQNVVEHDFLLINDGGQPLVIAGVKPRCHCTRVERPQKPIRPGHGGRLKLFLDVRQVGLSYFSRTVEVYPEGLPPQIITIKGKVEP